MKYIDWFFHKFHLLMVNAAKVMLVAMTLITFVQVVCRYGFDFSIRWSEEVPLILMVWFGFISMAIGVKKRLHISIEVFFSLLPKKAQKVLLKIVDAIIMIFGCIMVYYGFNLSRYMMASTMPATKMPTGFLYGVIVLSGIMIVYDTFMDLIGHTKLDDESSEILKAMEEVKKNKLENKHVTGGGQG